MKTADALRLIQYYQQDMIEQIRPSRPPAWYMVLSELEKCEAEDELDDAEVVQEGFHCYVGLRRIHYKTLDVLIRMVALSVDSGDEALRRFRLNETGRDILRRAKERIAKNDRA